MGPESVRRGRLTSSCPGPTERQGAEPLPRTLLQSQRRPAADAVVATKHSDRRRASRRRRGGDEDGKWLAKSDVPKLFINGHPGARAGSGSRFRPQLAEPDRITVPEGHFIQEDSPDEIAAAVAQLVEGAQTAGRSLQGRASKTRLNGVSAARRNRVKPPSFTITFVSRCSPACAPSAGPCCASETGTQMSDDAP